MSKPITAYVAYDKFSNYPIVETMRHRRRDCVGALILTLMSPSRDRKLYAIRKVRITPFKK